MIGIYTQNPDRTSFDAHNHLQDRRLAFCLDEVLRAAALENITSCLTCATSPDDWGNVARLTTRDEIKIFPAFGIHPWYANSVPPDWPQRLIAWLRIFPDAPVGEIGLDAIRNGVARETQLEILKAQLDIAAQMGRPVVLHGARAWDELFAVCRMYADYLPLFHLHAFSASQSQLDRWLRLNSIFSVGGAIVRPIASRLRKTVRAIPRERLFFETDAPDLLPENSKPAVENTRLNHPANLRDVIRIYESLDHDKYVG